MYLSEEMVFSIYQNQIANQMGYAALLPSPKVIHTQAVKPGKGLIPHRPR